MSFGVFVLSSGARSLYIFHRYTFLVERGVECVDNYNVADGSRWKRRNVVLIKYRNTMYANSKYAAIVFRMDNRSISMILFIQNSIVLNIQIFATLENRLPLFDAWF